MSNHKHIRGNAIYFLLPPIGCLDTVAKERVAGSSVYTVDADLTEFKFPVNREFSQRIAFLFAYDGERVFHGRIGETPERGRTLRIHIEPHRVVMIPSNRNCRVFLYPLNDLARPGAIVHKIADTPNLVTIGFWKCFQRSQISMNIGDDYHLHENLVSLDKAFPLLRKGAS
jgi:hypothetical protein